MTGGRARGSAARLLASAAAAALLASAAHAADAFPGAEGYGREAAGGRGGRIVAVTNLDDSGPGSLRDCVGETGPRVCVFRVAGTIVLKRSLLIDGEQASFLSILGQTAPGQGVTLTVEPDSKSQLRTVLVIRETHDVVVRHLRLRPTFPATVRNADAVTVEEASRVYLDHVSGAWASDENVSTHRQTSDLTIAYSVFGEGLLKHSKCALLGSDPKAPQRISFWRNLCISNNDRNPDVNHQAGSCVEITDNVFYNARSEWAEVFSQQPGGTPVSFVGNTFKAGPSTRETSAAIQWQDVKSAAPPRIFADANALFGPRSKRVVLAAENTGDRLVAEPACPLVAPSFRDPRRAYDEVRAQAGAFPRDATDRRFAEELGDWEVAGTGAVRRAPGEIEPIETAAPYADGDGDGMADALEPRFGATPGVADPWSHPDGEWTSLDLFMQWLAEERVAGRYPD